MVIEQMSDFFTARVDGYDDHMLHSVKGCKEGYVKLAELVPKNATTLLDLGCGTGLELDEIFKFLPHIKVTGVDLTKAMLDRLREKHHDKDITLFNADYFGFDFGVEVYDVIISFQTMHHFSHKEKIGLYSKIHKSLKNYGLYIECDYMITEQSDEEFFYSESDRIRKEQNIPEGEFYHYDTPCTIDNQIKMLKKAGFVKPEMIWRMENTTIIIANRD